MLVTSIFSFAHIVFYSFQHKFQFLNHYLFIICKCFEFGQGQNFVVCRLIKSLANVSHSPKETLRFYHLTHIEFPFMYFNPFPNKPLFLRVCSTSLLKTLWEKEKLLVTSNFSFSQCILPIWRTFYNFDQELNCHLQTLSVWKSLQFVIWERLKQLARNILQMIKVILLTAGLSFLIYIKL